MTSYLRLRKPLFVHALVQFPDLKTWKAKSHLVHAGVRMMIQVFIFLSFNVTDELKDIAQCLAALVQLGGTFRFDGPHRAGDMRSAEAAIRQLRFALTVALPHRSSSLHSFWHRLRCFSALVY